jgi:hypothetical protein
MIIRYEGMLSRNVSSRASHGYYCERFTLQYLHSSALFSLVLFALIAGVVVSRSKIHRGETRADPVVNSNDQSHFVAKSSQKPLLLSWIFACRTTHLLEKLRSLLAATLRWYYLHTCVLMWFLLPCDKMMEKAELFTSRLCIQNSACLTNCFSFYTDGHIL